MRSSQILVSSGSSTTVVGETANGMSNVTVLVDMACGKISSQQRLLKEVSGKLFFPTNILTRASGGPASVPSFRIETSPLHSWRSTGGSSLGALLLWQVMDFSV